MTIARKGLVLVLVPVLFQFVFVVVVAIIEHSHRRQREAELQTREVLAAADRLLALIVDSETGVRGYVITTDERFLEPYVRAGAALPLAMQDLESLAGADAVAKVRTTAAAAREFHKTVVAGVRAGRRDAEISEIRELIGKRRVDAFRAATTELIAARNREAAIAAARSERTRTSMYGAMVVGLAADAILAAMLSVFFSRSITRRLARVTENTRRVERGEPLAPVLDESDEIGELDARLHEMAETIDTSQKGLAAANEELSAFSYSVSHDLRAPIRAIDGYARMLQEDYVERLDDDGTRFLSTIRSEANRMGRLIDDLLAFSKLTRVEVAHTAVDVGALVDEVIEQLRRRGAETTVFHVGDIPPALGDRAMLQQVIVNLISNAVKFSRGSTPPVVEIGARSSERENVYWVRDNGVGFDMRYAGKLFGVFQRLHKFDDFEGTGVGLAIVQRVVARHGGRVWAESSPGAGATFFFTLPASMEIAA
jgi:signal transduction histidine kinase